MAPQPSGATETPSLRKRKRGQKDEERRALKKRNSTVGQPNGICQDMMQTDTSPVGQLPPTSHLASPQDSLECIGDAMPKWIIGTPMGGRMLDIDPIFSPDEKFLILTYCNSVQVYDTESSLLVRRIALDINTATGSLEDVSIVASVLSRTSPNSVWVSSTDGRIWCIDYTSGSGADKPFFISTKKVIDMGIEAVKFGTQSEDVLIVIQGLTAASAEVFAYNKVALMNQAGHRILKCGNHPKMVRPLLGGTAMVVVARDRITLAFRTRKVEQLSELEYRVWTFTVPDIISCIDIRNSGSFISLAIGCAQGFILVYHGLPMDGSIPSELQPKKYHWHRRAVFSVRWSQDGNYLISGGSESVLVLWQMDTGKCDFYPHLGATIERIVISPMGSSYALQLDDNSAMVLSMAEMKPTAYVTGLQSPVFLNRPSKNSLMKSSRKRDEGMSTPLVAVIHPTNSQVYLCVGNGQEATGNGQATSTPLVQIFDLHNFQCVAKTALARTFTTDKAMTKEGYPISEPTVTRMAFSSDGGWLASVDEWQPPERDMEPLLTGSTTAAAASRRRREIYLKFWSVSGISSLELVSRHDLEAEEIFDLVSDPMLPRFATIAKDSLVRFYTAKRRTRDGLTVPGPEGQALKTWACSMAIRLPTYGRENEDSPAHTAQSGGICFSEDGSLLFAALGSSEAVIAIDTATGDVRDVVFKIVRGEVRAIRSLGSCLIILSDDLTVYDIVSDELQYSFSLKDSSKAGLSQLMLNTQLRCFALTAPIPVPGRDMVKKGTDVDRPASVRRGTESELLIFSLYDQEPLLVKTFPKLITSVLPATGFPGFILIDSAAQVWSVTEGPAQSSVLRPLADMNLDKPEPEEGDDLVEDGTASDEEMPDIDRDEQMEDDVYPVVLAPQRLADIFDGAPAFAMPPIEDIFYKVTTLLSRPLPERQLGNHVAQLYVADG